MEYTVLARYPYIAFHFLFLSRKKKYPRNDHYDSVAHHQHALLLRNSLEALLEIFHIKVTHEKNHADNNEKQPMLTG